MNDAPLLDARLSALLAESAMLVVCGPGGVGKTTSAAALGVVAARQFDRRVLVLTVDPARRLATALGLSALGNIEVPVHLDDARGSLTMAMIDTKSSWDDMIRRHAPDEVTCERILSNDLYKTLTSRFVHSHDYVVTERLFEARESGKFDLVIVDTPPSRSALSVLDAPRRMEQFFGSRLLRLLTAPTQSRLLSLASRPFFIVADRILGAAFLTDISEFFTLFRTMEQPIVSRARKVGSLLTESATTYLVVTSAESVAMSEARFLADELSRRRLQLAAVLVNRLVPTGLAVGAADRASRLERDQRPEAQMLARAEREFSAIAQRQERALSLISTWGVPTLLSEDRLDDLGSAAALARLGEAIHGR